MFQGYLRCPGIIEGRGIEELYKYHSSRGKIPSDESQGVFQGVTEGFETKWERTKCTGNDSEKYSQDMITGIWLNVGSGG